MPYFVALSYVDNRFDISGKMLPATVLYVNIVITKSFSESKICDMLKKKHNPNLNHSYSIVKW